MSLIRPLNHNLPTNERSIQSKTINATLIQSHRPRLPFPIASFSFFFHFFKQKSCLVSSFDFGYVVHRLIEDSDIDRNHCATWRRDLSEDLPDFTESATPTIGSISLFRLLLYLGRTGIAATITDNERDEIDSKRTSSAQ